MTRDMSRAQYVREMIRLGFVPSGVLGYWSLQMDPRGWPTAIHATAADRTDWEYNGSPRELIRVTPHA